MSRSSRHTARLCHCRNWPQTGRHCARPVPSDAAKRLAGQLVLTAQIPRHTSPSGHRGGAPFPCHQPPRWKRGRHPRRRPLGGNSDRFPRWKCRGCHRDRRPCRWAGADHGRACRGACPLRRNAPHDRCRSSAPATLHRNQLQGFPPAALSPWQPDSAPQPGTTRRLWQFAR